MSIKSRTLLACAASLLALGACTPKEPGRGGPASATNGTAATVNGVAIKQSRVDQLVKQRAAQGQPDNQETRSAIIEQLAMQLIVAQEAVKKGLDRAPETSDQLELTRQSILANAYVQDYFKNAPVTDEMIKAEYEKIKGEMTGTEFKARHILVEKESEASDIIARLKKNPNAFEALAKEKSKDPGSAAKGGDLGWFDPRGMVPEFGLAVAKLDKGKMSEAPVKSQYGYHVIMLEDSRPIAAPSFDVIKTGLKQQVQQQNLRKLLDDFKAKAKIEIPQAAAPAQQAKSAQPVKK